MVDLEKVSGMESELKEKGADVPSNSELSVIQDKFDQSIKQVNDYVKNYK